MIVHCVKCYSLVGPLKRTLILSLILTELPRSVTCTSLRMSLSMLISGFFHLHPRTVAVLVLPSMFISNHHSYGSGTWKSSRLFMPPFLAHCHCQLPARLCLSHQCLLALCLCLTQFIVSQNYFSKVDLDLLLSCLKTIDGYTLNPSYGI